jgi:hypothetical protein
MRFLVAGLFSLALLFGAQTVSSQSEGVDMEQPAPDDAPAGEPIELPPGMKLDPAQPLPDGTPMNVDLTRGVVDPALQPLIDVVQQQLSQHLGVAPEDMEVLEARSVVWNDGSIGCPTPGMAYIQVQVEGALVRLRVGDQTYEYHTGGNRAPFLCDHPFPRVPRDIQLPSPGGSAAV